MMMMMLDEHISPEKFAPIDACSLGVVDSDDDL